MPAVAKAVALLVLIATILGAGYAVTSGAKDKAPKEFSIWEDPETGCRYLRSAGYQGNFSIRFRRDGTPDCPGPRGEK